MKPISFDLITQEKILFAGEVIQVDMPGKEGEFGVLAGHVPCVVMLRPGIVTIHQDTSKSRFAVRGGFAEFSSDKLTVLADYAIAVEDIDSVTLVQAIKDAEEDLADAKTDDARSNAYHRIEQLNLLKIGLDSRREK
jgi:F-type H+-transporting ATPase subunit epsilon